MERLKKKKTLSLFSGNCCLECIQQEELLRCSSSVSSVVLQSAQSLPAVKNQLFAFLPISAFSDVTLVA